MNWLESAPAREIDPVLDCISYLARDADRPSSAVLICAGLALTPDGKLPFHQIEPALEQIGMRGETLSRRLRSWPARKCPAVLGLQDGRAVILLDVKDKDGLVYAPGMGAPAWVPMEQLEPVYAGQAVVVETDPTQEREAERPWDKARHTHWFWSEVWKTRRDFWPVIMAAFVINMLALALPLFTMNVYDRVIPNKAISTLWVLAFGVLLAFAFDFTLRIARAQVIDDIGRKLDAKLAQKLFEKVMNLPMSDRQGSTGAFAKRISEYELVRDFFASTTVVLIVDVLFLFLFLGLILILAGWLVFVPIAIMAVMFVAGMSLQRAMGRVAVEAQADASLQHSVLVESLSGTETLKSARAEGQMLGRWKRYSEMTARTQERMRRLTAVAVNLASVSQQLISVCLLIGGFYRFNEGEMTMGAIIAIVMLAGRSLQPVGQLAFLITRQRQAFATLDSLQRMMEVADERQGALRTIVPEIRSGNIEMSKVSFRYPGATRNSLSDVNLAIKPGERIGIIGRVASGKSTLGRVLCGLYAPGEGELIVDGSDSRQYHPHQLREQFRFVAQDADVFSGSVRENLKLGSARADDAQLVDAVVRSGADIFLSRDAAGFDLDVGERGGRLSGGQRALLVLARALVTPCKMLFLDEPTGSMDTQTELYFIDHLKSALAKDQALVVATHRHNMLSLVDRLIVIDGGRILADGPRDEVLKRMGQPGKAPKGQAA